MDGGGPTNGIVHCAIKKCEVFLLRLLVFLGQIAGPMAKSN